MKKGFTLMEVLAVVLVIAVVASLAVPMLRSVRAQVKNSQAKAAAVKLAEGMRSFYQANRGYKIDEHRCFTPTSSTGKNLILTPASACEAPGKTGIPAPAGDRTPVSVNQLFACGYLSFKDFKGLPYEFCTYKKHSFDDPKKDKNFMKPEYAFVTAVGVGDKAGDRYKSDKGYIYVDARLVANDTYDEEH